MITVGNILADVGTDHGYIPIYQVQQGNNPKAIAMDLREGPLERAKDHIHKCGLDAQIETRLSDGVEALFPGEAESIVVAGMGGELVIHILTAGDKVCRMAKELILQPQSEIAEVRRFLQENAYQIVAEDMVFEDGKYYPMMRVMPVEKPNAEIRKETDAFDTKLKEMYGEQLLFMRHPILKQYLDYQKGQLEEILQNLSKQQASQKIEDRIEEIKDKIAYNLAALSYFEMVK